MVESEFEDLRKIARSRITSRLYAPIHKLYYAYNIEGNIYYKRIGDSTATDIKCLSFNATMSIVDELLEI